MHDVVKDQGDSQNVLCRAVKQDFSHQQVFFLRPVSSKTVIDWLLKVKEWSQEF